MAGGEVNHYYQDVPGWFDFEDVYRQAVADAPDGATLVEIGCYRGKSMSFLLVEAVNSGKRLKIFGVDHFRGGEEQWMKDQARDEPIRDECRWNCARAGYAGFRLVELPSVEAAREFDDGSVFFCFIDGSHDPRSVREDLAAWTPKIAPGGRLAGHDWGCSGVTDAVREAFGDRVVPRPPASWEVRF